MVRYNEPLWIIPSVQIGQGANGAFSETGFWQLNTASYSRTFGVDVVRDQGITGVSSMTDRYVPDTSGDLHDNPSTVWSVRDRTGAQHPYQIDTSQGSTSSLAADGSGWLPSFNPATGKSDFKDKSGLSYSWVHPSAAPGTLGSWNITDLHSNSITVGSDGWHDSLGKTIPGSWSAVGNGFISLGAPAEDDPFPGVATSDLSRCPNGTAYARTWIVPANSDAGGSATYSFCYSSMSLSTQFNVTTIGGFTGAATEAQTTVSPLTAIVLPNGKSYVFTYDPHFGDLIRIDFPTGGSILYAYAVVIWDGCSTSTPYKRVVTSRTVSDTSSFSSTWHYRWFGGVYCGGGSADVVVTNPDGNDEWHQTIDNTSNGGSLIRDTISYQGLTGGSTSPTGTMLKKVETTQLSNPSIFYTSTPDVFIADNGGSYSPGYLEKQYFPTPILKSVTTMYDPSTQQIQTTQETDYTPVASSGAVQWYNPGHNPWAPATSGHDYGTCTCLNYSEIATETVHDVVAGGG